MTLGGIDQSRGHLLGFGFQKLGPRRAVGELLDDVWRPNDELRRKRRGAQDFHEALADDAFVAKHAQEPGTVVGCFRKLAVVQQAHVWIRGVREPLHQRGQQNGLDASLARLARGQRSQMLEGSVRMAIAQRRQLQEGCLARQLELIRRHRCHGIEQRAVEQARVELRDKQANLPEMDVHPIRRRLVALRVETRVDGQPLERRVVILRRQRMCSAETLQLEAVLQKTKKLVGLNELGAILAPYVPGAHECGERIDRRERAQRFIRATVHQLEQLDCELYIAQTALPQFELAKAHLFRDVLEHAAAHSLYVFNKGLPLRGSPHHGPDLAHIILA